MSWLDVLSGAIEQALGPQAIIYCLAAIGLNIHFGYTGLLNFGQAAFMMVGGYAVGALVQTWEQNLWLSIVVGLLASVVLALVLGVPTLRLRADYLAIATIAAAEAIRQVLGSGHPERPVRRPGRPVRVRRQPEGAGSDPAGEAPTSGSSPGAATTSSS